MSSRTDNDVTFGQWLKRKRRQLALTQAALAEQVGCSVETIRAFEYGRRRPSPEMVERLAAVFELSVEERSQALRLARSSGQGPRPGPPQEQSTFNPPMLLTKILPSPLRHQAVLRPRLMAQLSDGRDGGIILVVAPAGWGKTTLLNAWIASLPPEAQNVAWLALDETDADVVLFLRYVIAALQHHYPRLGVAALRHLDTPQPSIEAVLALLINDIISLGAPLVLALDDYHVIRLPAIHQALNYLVERLPPNLQLVIASREDPPLPLARLRTRQRLQEIRAADLRFTPDEAALFLNEVMGLALSDHEITALEQRTEGWIAGLQLAALAMRERPAHSGFIQSFSGSHHLVLDYLAEEVLAHLPPHLYQFLLRTSILDRLCGPLCDAILSVHAQDSEGSYNLPVPEPRFLSAVSDSQGILEQLERLNLFVVPLDDQRIWYRYHHLFGAVLRERLQRSASASVVAALHERASIWFETQGMVAEAIHHALAAHRGQRAANLIEQIGDELLQSGSIERLQQLITTLPPAIREARPRLLYLHGRCVRQVFDVARARLLFEQAAAAFGTAGNATGRGESLIILADCYRMLGAYDQARQALAEALDSPLPPARRAVALLSRAYEAMAAEDWPAVIPLLNSALDLIEQSGDQRALHDVAINLTSLTIFLPGGTACARRVRQLIAWQPIAPLSLIQAADLFMQALIQFVEGNLVAAYETFEELRQVKEQLGALSQIHVEVALWYAHCAALLGNVAAADQHLDRTITLLAQPSLALFHQQNGTIHLAVQSLINWTQGRYEAVQSAAAEAEKRANNHEWPVIGRIRRLMRALAFLGQRDWTAAEPLLVAAYTQQRQSRETVPFGDAGLLLAHLYLQVGREAEAWAALNEALALHEQHDTPGILLLVGAPVVVPLLRQAVAHGIHAPFAGQTLRRFLEAFHTYQNKGSAPPASTQATTDPDRLTPRELEVLRLIALGASNSEIAGRLIISLATVKKHINNIFAKLDANSRTLALVRARERGLL